MPDLDRDALREHLAPWTDHRSLALSAFVLGLLGRIDRGDFDAREED